MENMCSTLENLISKYTYAFPTNGKTIFDDMSLSGAVALYEIMWTTALDNNLRNKKGANFKENLAAMIEVFKTEQKNR
jgi:hypothetical protein